jgi:hypothetical protein
VAAWQWNSPWNAAGLTDGSLAVPANPIVKLQHLRAYRTAAACEAAVQAVRSAQSDGNQSNTDAGNAQSALEAGIAPSLGAGRSKRTPVGLGHFPQSGTLPPAAAR